VNRHGRTAFDWDSARAQLERSARALAEGDTAARADEILRARARRLARPPSDEGAGAADLLQIIGFRLAGERHAIEITYLREVVAAFRVTPVPRAPHFVLGVSSLRGEVLSVFDLAPRLGLKAAPATPAARLLVLGRERAELGIVVEAVEAVTTLARGELALPSRRVPYIRGVTRQAQIMLDGAALLDDPELVVQCSGNGRV
jgi:purine-binding chemotaxis protein CheW